MQTESLGSAATLEMLVVSRCREEHGGGGAGTRWAPRTLAALGGVRRSTGVPGTRWGPLHWRP